MEANLALATFGVRMYGLFSSCFIVSLLMGASIKARLGGCGEMGTFVYSRWECRMLLTAAL